MSRVDPRLPYAVRRYAPAVLLAAFALGPRIAGPVRLGDLLFVAALPFFVRSWNRARAEEVDLALHERAALLFLGWGAVATLVGLATGSTGRGGEAALCLLRLVEIAGLYAMAATGAGVLPGAKTTAIGAAALLLAWSGAEAWEAYVRSGHEFLRAFNEGIFEGEANHVAGCLALFTVLHPAIPLLALPAILLSGSRIALAAALVGLLRRAVVERRRLLVAVVPLAAVVMILAAPDAWRRRFDDVLPERNYSGPHVDRFRSWAVVLGETPLLFGNGLGARPSSVYESAPVLIFAETGLPGLLLALSSFGGFFLRRGGAEEGGDAETMRSVALVFGVLSLTMNTILIARVAAPAAILWGAARSRPGASVPPG